MELITICADSQFDDNIFTRNSNIHRNSPSLRSSFAKTNNFSFPKIIIFIAAFNARWRKFYKMTSEQYRPNFTWFLCTPENNIFYHLNKNKSIEKLNFTFWIILSVYLNTLSARLLPQSVKRKERKLSCHIRPGTLFITITSWLQWSIHKFNRFVCTDEQTIFHCLKKNYEISHLKSFRWPN